ncbi:maf-like protein DDB_G0281937 isoform X2 [Selaginella moellendorffii]|uniref:maf-like protein DDB_G0281937 n=1 Tax=Selaginella moellendorffii TaxID=88036 RepID=UPI000D1CD221|nr:maf-like protein DDB_G0281937 [Selaginella moellendorffii]XP_024529590.1 maf-like protein DDB_G0281937 isoform X1 [Selaginella moellendorffii]XP_024529592.1 maf-like protein DDB_G0281937 isoform X2 [Selaginella moellendorffii]|eukprot:XP_024520177.1 maf-like protein DDB_G0281937 [Selaginella moellendorffii]
MGLEELGSVKIILGSSSQTRQAVLREMGYNFTVMSADIDERAIRRETPEELVMALAHAKAQAILPRITSLETSDEEVLLITADQVVVNGGVVREKPLNGDEARTFIAGYARDPAITVSAVLVTNVTTGVSNGSIDKAEIYFHPIPEQVIDDLIKEGSVLYAAGGLLVEHPLVSPFVQSMIGTLDSVMGLPKELTHTLIRDSLSRNKEPNK